MAYFVAFPDLITRFISSAKLLLKLIKLQNKNNLETLAHRDHEHDSGRMTDISNYNLTANWGPQSHIQYLKETATSEGQVESRKPIVGHLTYGDSNLTVVRNDCYVLKGKQNDTEK
jgi:hypothetical protein